MLTLDRVSEPEILGTIRRLVSAGVVLYTDHARQRMWDRNVTLADVRHALIHASTALEQANGRWRIDGTDTDGDELTVVVLVHAGLVVITVF